VTKTTSYGDISPQVAAYLVDKMLSRRATGPAPAMQQVLKSRRVEWFDVPCRSCRAPAGEPCKKWSYSRKGKVIRKRGAHDVRKGDARAATEAVQALI
jgi:hypothetical protein